ncbi:uncharacterized protein LOC141662127 [Apium graveolens]|uniref:uncharacterized protein LOC141662127 n=1 Tax=Apium graveolens TaxID=4045 RepID=UPI003D796A3C
MGFFEAQIPFFLAIKRWDEAVFRKVFQCYNSSSNICGWVYVKQRPKSKHIFNSASIPDNNQNWRNSFVGLRWENGDWGTLFRSSFGKVSDGSLKSIHLTPEETIIYNGLTQDDGTTTSWTLLEEFSLIHVGLSSVSQQAAKEINEDNVPLVEETARMKKARLAGLDTRGKATEPIFLKKHKEPMGEASTEGVGGHSAPITAAAPTATATGAFQPLWGFRRGDTVVGSTKHAWDWSYHSVTPKDFTDVVATPDLERIKLMGAQSLALMDLGSKTGSIGAILAGIWTTQEAGSSPNSGLEPTSSSAPIVFPKTLANYPPSSPLNQKAPSPVAQICF